METDSIVTNQLKPQTTFKSSKENSISVTEMIRQEDRQDEMNSTKAKTTTVVNLPQISDKTNTPVNAVKKLEEIPINEINPPKEEQVVPVEDPGVEVSSVRESEATNLIGGDRKSPEVVPLSETILTG